MFKRKKKKRNQYRQKLTKLISPHLMTKIYSSSFEKLQMQIKLFQQIHSQIISLPKTLHQKLTRKPTFSRLISAGM